MKFFFFYHTTSRKSYFDILYEKLAILSYFVPQVHIFPIGSATYTYTHTYLSICIKYMVDMYICGKHIYIYVCLLLCLLILHCTRMRSKPKSEPRPTGRFLCRHQTPHTSLFLCILSYVHFIFFVCFYIRKLLDRKFN